MSANPQTGRPENYPFHETVNSEKWLRTEIPISIAVFLIAIALITAVVRGVPEGGPQMLTIMATTVIGVYAATVGSLRARTMIQLLIAWHSRRKSDELILR